MDIIQDLENLEKNQFSFLKELDFLSESNVNKSKDQNHFHLPKNFEISPLEGANYNKQDADVKQYFNIDQADFMTQDCIQQLTKRNYVNDYIPNYVESTIKVEEESQESVFDSTTAEDSLPIIYSPEVDDKQSQQNTYVKLDLHQNERQNEDLEEEYSESEDSEDEEIYKEELNVKIEDNYNQNICISLSKQEDDQEIYNCSYTESEENQKFTEQNEDFAEEEENMTQEQSNAYYPKVIQKEYARGSRRSQRKRNQSKKHAKFVKSKEELKIVPKIDDKKIKKRQVTLNYKNKRSSEETKNLPTTIGKILLKCLKKKLPHITPLQKMKAISNKEHFQQLFSIHPQVQHYSLQFLTSGPMMSYLASSTRLKQKRLVVKYLDIIVEGAIDPQNFKCFKQISQN